jgi:hypothetical protein
VGITEEDDEMIFITTVIDNFKKKLVMMRD